MTYFSLPPPSYITVCSPIPPHPHVPAALLSGSNYPSALLEWLDSGIGHQLSASNIKAYETRPVVSVLTLFLTKAMSDQCLPAVCIHLFLIHPGNQLLFMCCPRVL